MNPPNTKQEVMAFQRQISQIAKDIAILWNHNIDRYQIYQVDKTSDIQDIHGRTKYRPHLIFTIQEKNGDYKPFGRDTLKMIARSVELSHEIQKYTPEEYEKKLTEYDEDIVERRREKMNHEIRERIHEVAPYYLKNQRIFR